MKTMSTTDKIAVRRDAVARAPYALIEAITAAISLGFVKASPKEDGTDHADLAEQEIKFKDAETLAVECLAVVCKEADSFRAMSERPQNILQALNAAAGAHKFHSLAVDEYLTRLEVWRRADAQSARIRVAVTERLQLSPDQGGKALSASAADKAASGDPEYTEHKDAVADLSDGKDAAEYEMKIADGGLRVALATLEAFTALQRNSGYQFLSAEQIMLATGTQHESTGDRTS